MGDPFAQLAQQVAAAKSTAPAAAAPSVAASAPQADPFGQLAQQVSAVQAAKTPPTAAAPWWRDALMAPVGGLETALQMASGSVAQPLAGLAGAGRLLTGASGAQAARTIGRVENDLTYQPRSAAGQSISHYAAIPFQMLARGANDAGAKVSDLTGSPGAGALVNAGIQTLPMLLAAKLPALRDGADVPREVPEEVQTAHNAGLKITPVQAQAPGTFLGRLTESLMGHAKLERELSRVNAQRVTDLTAKDVGVEPPARPSGMQAAIRAAYQPHAAVYDELNNLGPITTDAAYQAALTEATNGRGFSPKASAPYTELRDQYAAPAFTGQQALEEIQTLRKEGSEMAYSKRYDPPTRALGKARIKIANAIEDQIDRHLNSLASGTRSAPDVSGFMHEFEQQMPAADATGSMRRVGSADVALAPDTASPGAINVRLIESGESPPIGPFGLRKLLALADKHNVPLTATALSGDDVIPTQALADHYEKVGFTPTGGSAEDGIQMRREPNATRSAQADWAQQAKDLIPRYRAARQAMARLSSFERAWGAGNGQAVSALSLGRQLKTGVPLTGALRDVAESAQNFPRSFQDLSKLRDNGPLSNFDLKLGTLAAAVKPEVLAAYLGPPALRRLLASDWYQRRAFGPESEPLIPSFPMLKRSARGLPLLSLEMPQVRER